MAVAEASFKISIETISAGLIFASGFVFTELVDPSIITPSITKIGSFDPFNELIPRIRIEELEPGAPLFD
ncbi:hypothetical protein D3C84_939030 [compost metagenome]